MVRHQLANQVMDRGLNHTMLLMVVVIHSLLHIQLMAMQLTMLVGHMN
jgi:hypothetical protein